MKLGLKKEHAEELYLPFRWTGDNREIIARAFEAPFSPSEEFNNYLMHKYKAPTSADAVVNQQSVGTDLNRHNYIHKMHKMLQLEELTRHHIIARSVLNAKTMCFTSWDQNHTKTATSSLCILLHCNGDTTAFPGKAKGYQDLTLR